MSEQEMKLTKQHKYRRCCAHIYAFLFSLFYTFYHEGLIPSTWFMSKLTECLLSKGRSFSLTVQIWPSKEGGDSPCSPLANPKLESGPQCSCTFYTDIRGFILVPK